MAATPIRIDHLAFPGFDAGATHRFYTEVMGFRLAWASTGSDPAWGRRPYLMATYARDGVEITFFALEGMEAPPPPPGVPADSRHVALSVGDAAEVEAWRAKLAALGLPHWVEDHGEPAPSLYFTDPNGVVFEITGDRNPNGAQPSEEDALEILRRWPGQGPDAGSFHP